MGSVTGRRESEGAPCCAKGLAGRREGVAETGAIRVLYTPGIEGVAHGIDIGMCQGAGPSVVAKGAHEEPQVKKCRKLPRMAVDMPTAILFPGLESGEGERGPRDGYAVDQGNDALGAERVDGARYRFNEREVNVDVGNIILCAQGLKPRQDEGDEGALNVKPSTAHEGKSPGEG